MLFDPQLRALRRDRAARIGGDRLLLERAFDDSLERACAIARRFETALLIGCPTPEWRVRMERLAATVDVIDPGRCFAAAAAGVRADEESHDYGQHRYDLCIAIGTLDTVNNLPLALRSIGHALRPDAPLLGALAGGNSLPALRAALIEAERPSGQIAMRVHPRIDAATLAGLLGGSGFVMPVIDVDRVRLRYRALADLIRDLRSMGATSLLADRPPPLSRAAFNLAAAAFAARGDGERIEEVIEILHFIAWSAPTRQAPD